MVTVTDDPELAALTREFEATTGRTVEDLLRDELRRRVPRLEPADVAPPPVSGSRYGEMNEEQRACYDGIMAMVDAYQRLPDRTPMLSEDEILGYGEDGLPC